MRQIHAARLCGALLAALAVSAFASARAEHFDPQKYFEEKAKEAARVQENKVRQHSEQPPAPPLSGGASPITTATYWIWIALGVAGAAVAAFVILWIKTPAFHFAPRVDDAIDKEFRAMIRETGEEPGEPEDALAPPRKGALREDDIIEDLTGEIDDAAEGPAGGRET